MGDERQAETECLSHNLCGWQVSGRFSQLIKGKSPDASGRDKIGKKTSLRTCTANHHKIDAGADGNDHLCKAHSYGIERSLLGRVDRLQCRDKDEQIACPKNRAKIRDERN